MVKSSNRTSRKQPKKRENPRPQENKGQKFKHALLDELTRVGIMLLKTRF